MIRQLMREQFRVQRAYMIWTTALLTLAIAFASYAAFVAAQQNATSQYVTEAYGMDGTWNSTVYVGDPDIVLEPSVTVSVAALDAVLAKAQSEGAGVVAYASDALALAPAVSSDSIRADALALDAIWSVGSLTGDVDWDVLLADGQAPGRGEVAVDATWAQEHGISLGDTVRAGAVGGGDGFAFVTTDEVTVSGLLRPSLEGKYGVWQGEALVGWESLEELGRRPIETSHSISDLWVTPVQLSAQQETPALTALGGDEMWVSFSAYGGIAWMYLLAAGVLTVGLVGMAFAVGRSQAQVRLEWIATARVLGARRRSVAAASALETVAAGLLAGAVGTAAGDAAISIEWSATVASHPDALVPADVAGSAWLKPSMILLAILVAGIIGAVPAFWAARVAPAAALKPVTPLAEAATSRKVPVWPVVALWSVGAVGMLALVHGVPGDQGWAITLAQSPGFVTLAVAGMIAAAVTSVALMVELMRHLMRRIAARLSRSRRPWLIAAGTALEGRPAAASAPAAVMALATAAGVGVAAYAALYGWAETPVPGDEVLGPKWAALGPFSFAPSIISGVSYRLAAVVAMVVGALLVLVALAAHLSDRAAAVSEDRAQAALGLDARSARLASATRFALPLGTGALCGSMIGLAGACAMFSYSNGNVSDLDYDSFGPAWAFTHVSHLVIPAGVVVVPMLAMIGIGAGIAAIAARASAVIRVADRIAA